MRKPLIIPPYLQIGDTIALVCPSGHMPYTKVQSCIRTLGEWGLNVKIGKTVGSQFHYFSGTDTERLNDLQMMLDDKEVKAVFCARGGYGLSRIIDSISFRKFRNAPKWVVGYSDITVLHSHLYAKLHAASLHAPMASAFNDADSSDKYIQSIRAALTGLRSEYTVPRHSLNRNGQALGPLIGGNLSIIAHLCGTASSIDTTGKIMFIEDVGEYRYQVDRMMMQLKRAGKLERLAGLIVGGFTEIKDTVIPFGEPVEELIFDKVKEYSFPVCFDFPVSHTNRNYALKFGLPHELAVSEEKVTLKQRD